MPKQHGALRLVPSYPQFIHERFERCLDLYLCPRAHKEKLSIDPKSLVPQLPKPRELRPFPNVQALQVLPCRAVPCLAAASVAAPAPAHICACGGRSSRDTPGACAA